MFRRIRNRRRQDSDVTPVPSVDKRELRKQRRIQRRKTLGGWVLGLSTVAATFAGTMFGTKIVGPSIAVVVVAIGMLVMFLLWRKLK